MLLCDGVFGSYYWLSLNVYKIGTRQKGESALQIA